jgi:hypothetical protein
MIQVIGHVEKFGDFLASGFQRRETFEEVELHQRFDRSQVRIGNEDFPHVRQFLIDDFLGLLQSDAGGAGDLKGEGIGVKKIGKFGGDIHVQFVDVPENVAQAGNSLIAEVIAEEVKIKIIVVESRRSLKTENGEIPGQSRNEPVFVQI